MLCHFFKKKILFWGLILSLVFYSVSTVYAGNPVTPILPSDNIQDPGDPGTAWGGCGPSDSNCYVTFGPAGNSGELQFNNAGVFGGVPALTYSSSNLYLNSTLYSPIGTGGGGGSPITFEAGNGDTDASGGVISFTAGKGVGTGTGGQVQIFAGESGATNGEGGSMLLAGGNGIGATGKGGYVDVTGGGSFSNGTPLGETGNVRIYTIGTAGKAGDVILTAGEGSSGGLIYIGDLYNLGNSTLLTVDDRNTKTTISNNIRFSTYGAGAITADASGNLTSASDERLKNIQGQYTTGLAGLINVNPITYRWNTLSELETEHLYAGFSAQNVRDNIPYGTGINKDGYLSLQDRAILATTVNAIKEMNLKITGINNFNIKNTWRDSLLAWFANAGNRITRIFTGEICLTDPNGTSECINKTQLGQLKQLLNTVSSPTP